MPMAGLSVLVLRLVEGPCPVLSCLALGLSPWLSRTDGLDWQAVAGNGSTAQAQKTSSQRQFALSQRVSGPPCRAPAVATLLLKRKTEKPTIAALDGKMRTWRPPLAEIGTGRHALAIYWLNSGHGERYCYRHCARAWDDAKQHKTQYLVRAGSPLSLRYHSNATVPEAIRAPSLLVPPLTPSRSLEPLANLDKHSTHTLTPPKNSPSRPCTPDHPRPGSAKPSRLKAIISLEPSPFFGRYVVAVVASPLHRPPDRDRIALTTCLGADTGCLLPRIAATTIWRHGRSSPSSSSLPELATKKSTGAHRRTP
ncbi:hypothetical protein Trihar35433_8108 [Trichoderma harzianum]|nr:hypothetical protein Trihar35433_8108 [Trichoderma harzianum]